MEKQACFSLGDIQRMVEEKADLESKIASLTLCSEMKDDEGILEELLENPEIKIPALAGTLSKAVAMNVFDKLAEEFVEKVENGEFEGVEVNEEEPEEFQA